MDVEEAPEIRRIRITLTSRNVTNVEKVCTNLKSKALQKSHLVRAGDKEYQSVRVHGPVRMPTKKLKLSVRKAPNGEGTNTYDRFEMRIHKRVLELFCAKEVVSQIANIAMEPGVTVDVMDKPFYENITTVTKKKKQGA
jgi:small subunit ribosomal protein S20e